MLEAGILRAGLPVGSATRTLRPCSSCAASTWGGA